MSVHKRAMDTYTTADNTRANHNHTIFQPNRSGGRTFPKGGTRGKYRVRVGATLCREKPHLPASDLTGQLTASEEQRYVLLSIENQ